MQMTQPIRNFGRRPQMKGVSEKSLERFSSLKWRFLNIGEWESKSLILAALLVIDYWSILDLARSLKEVVILTLMLHL